jgi:hypothetical protein
MKSIITRSLSELSIDRLFHTSKFEPTTIDGVISYSLEGSIMSPTSHRSYGFVFDSTEIIKKYDLKPMFYINLSNTPDERDNYFTSHGESSIHYLYEWELFTRDHIDLQYAKRCYISELQAHEAGEIIPQLENKGIMCKVISPNEYQNLFSNASANVISDEIYPYRSMSTYNRYENIPYELSMKIHNINMQSASITDSLDLYLNEVYPNSQLHDLINSFKG